MRPLNHTPTTRTWGLTFYRGRGSLDLPDQRRPTSESVRCPRAPARHPGDPRSEGNGGGGKRTACLAPSSEEPVFAFSAGKTGGGGRAKGRLRRRRGARGRKGRSIRWMKATEAFSPLFFVECKENKDIASHVLYAEAEPGDEAAEEGEARRRSSCVARLETRCANAVGPTAQSSCAAGKICPYPTGDAGERCGPARGSAYGNAGSPKGHYSAGARAARARGRARAACRNRREKETANHGSHPQGSYPKMAGASASAQTRRNGFTMGFWGPSRVNFLLGPIPESLYRPLEKRVVRHVERRSPTCY